MLSKYRFWIVCAVLALLLVFSLVFLEKAAVRDMPKVLASYLLLEDGSRRTIALPFFENSPTNWAVYEYIVEIEWKKSLSSHIRVIPDDYLESITVNGRLMSEERYSGSGRGDWKNGLVVDFSSYLRDGKNELLFKISDRGGKYGMDLRGVGLHLRHSPFRISILALCILLTLVLVFLILQRFKIDRVLIILILLALAWHLVSLGVRDYQKYGHDLYAHGAGHMHYIHYIAERGALPPAHGWSYYHPPLYYILGAGVLQVAKALALTDPFKPLQLFSLILYWVFLAYSLRLLAEFLKQPWVYRLAAALLLFWPVGSLAALRIGNDALFYPFFMASLFYGHRWFVGGKWRDLLLASIICGIGFFAKISILPLAGVLGVLVLWRLYRRHATPSLRQALAVFAILGGCFFLSSVDKWAYEIKANHPKWYMAPFTNVNATHIYSPATMVKNRVVDFIIPDTKSWFALAYINPWEQSKYAPGRENIWNYMGKTSMYGEFSHPGKFREKYLAPFMNVSFVLLAALGFYGLSMLWRRRLLPYAPQRYYSGLSPDVQRGFVRRCGRWIGRARAYSKQYDFRFVLVVATILLLLGVLVRIYFPTPTSIDFRYIMPGLPVITAAVAAGLMRLAARERRWPFIFGNVLILCFALASLVFYFGI
jgi:hypothetical protein